MQHEPSGLLSYANGAAYSRRTLIPFLQLTSIQRAASHLSSEIGESSKMVPTLTENCFAALFALPALLGFKPIVLHVATGRT